MNRQLALKYCREELDNNNLKEWGIRVSSDIQFMGLCSHRDMTIFLNAHHIDTHPDPEIIDTIKHEVAHAIAGPGHGHDATWTTIAMGLGVNNLSACSTIGLDPRVIDAIRSGHSVEVEFEEKKIERQVTVEETVYQPKYKVTRLQERCSDCGKVAEEIFAIDTVDKEGNQCKLITLKCFHIVKRIIPKATPFEEMISNDWKPEVKNCKHKWNKNQCLECGEFKLFNFQVTGARFAEVALSVGKGVLIADDMGLGKTVQGLSVLRFDKNKKYKTMVVTKSAIKFQWFKQAVRWLGPEYIAQIISTSRDYLMPGLNLYIIPYDLLRRFKKEKLYALGINLVILDEVQQIKNPDSSRTQEVRKLVSNNPDCKVVELSGTPWKNRGSELFVALNLIDPVKFHSYQHFLDTWVEYYYQGNTKKMGGIRNVKKFKEYIANLVIRREFDEVMEEYPSVNRTKLPVQLDELNQSNYDEATSDFVAWWNEKVIGGEEEKTSGMEIIAKLQRMRHICGVAKIPATLTYLEEFVEEADDKIVVFVHHKDVGQLMYGALTNTNKESNPDWFELAQAIKDAGITVLTYTSAHTGKPEGTIIQDTFNNTKRVIMIASTLACGEGLDLQTCCKAILHERQWNPQNEDQAAPGRFKRIGQLSNVITVVNPEGEGTTDEYLDAMVDRKRRYFHAVHNNSEIVTWNQDDAMRELANTIVQKHAEKMRKAGKVKVAVSKFA
jgi:SNF2 family DNA or RNA helicase